MPIREADLRYLGKVIGKKPHLIFEQDDYYVVFAEMDKYTRGNFLAFHKNEIAKVDKELFDLIGYSQFHCDDIYWKIKGMNIDKGTENAYIISRLRNICYVLVKLKILYIEKDGNTIYFRRFSAPATPLKPISRQQVISKVPLPEKSRIAPLPPVQKQAPNKPQLPIQNIADDDLKKLFIEAYKQSRKRPDNWVNLTDIGTFMSKSPIYRAKKQGKLRLLAEKFGAEIRSDEHGLPIIKIKI